MINSLVDEKPVAQIINGEGMESRRNHTFTYHLKPDLCKERGNMVLHTLGLEEWTVLNWILSEHTEEIVELDNDQRVDDDNVNNEEVDRNRTLMPKGKKNKEKEQKLLLQQFFGSLPHLESHYCRKYTENMYLEPKWKNKADLYKLYLSYIKDEGKEHLKLSICTSFHSVFEENNLSLFQPKKIYVMYAVRIPQAI